MRHALNTLLRLREHARRESEQQLAQAERARDGQQARVDAVVEAVVTAREGVEAGDPLSLAHYHAFRLRQELTERRERARLGQRERELEASRGRHVARVREELSLEKVLDAQAERVAEDGRRRDDRVMDEVASRRWSVS